MNRRQNPPPPRLDRTSVLLRRSLNGLPGDTVSLGEINLQFRRRSFGGILVLLTCLGLLPVISFFAGLVMLIPAIQMAVGLQTPVLPRVISEQRISTARVQLLGGRVLPFLERAERYIKPRWLFVTTPPFPILIGTVIALLALVLLIPLPLVNLPPAAALLFLSLGILERDGVMIVIGLIIAALSIVLGFFMTKIAVEGVRLFVNSHFG